jgi:hypothetical protein
MLALDPTIHVTVKYICSVQPCYLSSSFKCSVYSHVSPTVHFTFRSQSGLAIHVTAQYSNVSITFLVPVQYSLVGPTVHVTVQYVMLARLFLFATMYQCTKNKRMIQIPTLGLFLTCT